MNKSWIIYILILLPGILFSQNIKEKELKAFSELKKGNYSKAIDSLDVIISNDPKPEYYLAKAEALYKLGEYKKALEYCNQIEKAKPFYASELKLRIFLGQNDYEKAKIAINENFKSRYKVSLFKLFYDPDFSGIYSLELNDFVLSGNFYSQTEKQVYQVERLIQDKKYSQALFVVDEILSRNNNVAQAQYLKSKIEYKEKNIEGALQSINSALLLKKANPEYLKQRITIEKELKQYNEALQDANKLVMVQPYETENYITKADLLFRTEHFDEAVELTNTILEILPENPDVLFLSGKSCYMKGDYFEALKAVNQSLQIKQDKEYYELRGDIYSSTHTYKYAIRDYSMYLDIEPYNGDIYAKKGFARLKTGDKKGACSDWEKGKRYGSYEAVRYLEKYCQ